MGQIHPAAGSSSLSSALSGYIPGLDGIRAISVLIVVVSHAGFEYGVPGGFGVTVFFAISGFLITNLLLREIEQTGTVDMKGFYIRRFLRLSPELLAFIFAMTICGALLGWVAGLWERLAALLYFFNYFFIFGERHGSAIEFPWRHLWSLSVEEHFYLLYPAMLLLFARRSAALTGVVLLIVVPLLWRCFLYVATDLPTSYFYVATDVRLDSIAWGCLLAVLLRQRLARGETLASSPFIGPLLFGSGLVLILLSLGWRNEDFRWTLRYTVQGAALFLLFANLLFDPRWRPLVNVLEWPPIRYIGRISYGIYLWHFLVIRLMQYAFDIDDHLLFLPPALLLSVLVAAVSYRLIDDPVKKLRRRFGSHVGYRTS